MGAFIAIVIVGLIVVGLLAYVSYDRRKQEELLAKRRQKMGIQPVPARPTPTSPTGIQQQMQQTVIETYEEAVRHGILPVPEAQEALRRCGINHIIDPMILVPTPEPEPVADDK